MTTLTFDLLPPRRPSLADLGGAQLQDDFAFPPDPTTDPTADMLNQAALVLQRLGAMVPAATVYVRVANGAITSAHAQALSTAVQAPTPGVIDSAFTATRLGTGSYLVTASANVLPSNGMPPAVRVVYDGQSSGLTRLAQCAQASDGVRVQVFDAAGVFQDCDFVVTIY